MYLLIYCKWFITNTIICTYNYLSGAQQQSKNGENPFDISCDKLTASRPVTTGTGIKCIT